MIDKYFERLLAEYDSEQTTLESTVSDLQAKINSFNADSGRADHLLASHDEKQKWLSQEFTVAQTEITLSAEVSRFVYGYRLGALMALEVFEGKDDLIVGGDA